MSQEELNSITHLNCSNTDVKEIPVLPNLTHLYCYRTKVKEILVKDFYSVWTINSDQIKIGCQIKTKEQWFKMSDEELLQLHSEALKFKDQIKELVK